MESRTPGGGLQVVWLKRDLRLADHRPLAAAIEAADRTGGRVAIVYVYEPDYWRLPDTDVRHLTAINRALKPLRAAVRERGGEVLLRVGDVVETLQSLHETHGVAGLHSHEETGNFWTYQRDRAVRRWTRSHRIDWTEQVQSGVVRRLRDRDGWAKNWARRMAEPLTPVPDRIPSAAIRPIGRIATPKSLGLGGNPHAKSQQPVSEPLAHELLDSFLLRRGERYHQQMSSPVTAFEACSRLSVHLAYGTVSMRQVSQRLAEHRDVIRQRKAAGEEVGTWPSALKSFGARLRWHCHFMQKLEDQPELEWENMNRVYDTLRSPDPDPERFAAWKEGRTGYPMVDACMRCVAETGYLNFRMRAMVVSFASYHLWLHWVPTSLYLARMFTDYEPGIHFPQHQMQSGTTGINTVRIYSPIKQVSDQDPEGVFIRRWVPELKNVPKKTLPQPERMTDEEQRAAGCIIGVDYPPPIVDHKTAYAEARAKVSAIRRTDAARSEAQAVLKKHGSRKSPDRRREAKRAATSTTAKSAKAAKATKAAKS